MRSDDIYWDLSLGGTVKLSTAWGKANLLVGEDGSDKIVAGYLVSSTNGAVIGAHNSALTDWAPLNVSGTYVNIRRNEITVAKFLDGCLSLFPLYNDYREGIRIHSYGSWSDILLCGNDNTGDTGTSANSWFIGNNNGTFNITRNGSSTGTAYLRCVDNKWYINTTTGGEQLNIGGWVGTVGNTGWYSITYGGGWYMTDSNFIRNCNSKAVSININSNNAWGIGSHRLAAVFKGNDHVSILLSTNTLGYGLCVNNNGNWYWGKRTSNSETSTSGDTYLLQGDTTLVRPSNNMAIGLGQIKASEFSSAYIRAVNARHLDASGVYSSDMNLYIGYGNDTPTQKTLFYYSTGTHGAAATSRTQFAEINSNGLYALTRFGVNGQNTGYNFYVNGTSYFNNRITIEGTSGGPYLTVNNNSRYDSDKTLDNYGINLIKFGMSAMDNYLGTSLNGKTFSGKYAYTFHTGTNYSFGWFTSGWTPVMELECNTGNLRTKGNIYLGGGTSAYINSTNYTGSSDKVDGLHATDFVRAYTTSNDNIDSDWGQSFKTFDPIPTGTPPEQNPNISLLSIGNNFERRKMFAFMYNNDNIYYRRRTDSSFSAWVKLLHTGNYAEMLDGRYVNVTGDTMTGTLANSTVKGGMWIAGTHECTFFSKNATTASAGSFYQGHYGLKTPSGAWSLGILSGSNDLYFVYGTDANYTSGTNSVNSNVRISSNGGIYGAVWNDYAEFREVKKDIEAGRVVIETGKGDLKLSTKRLQPGANVVSDTYGFAIGETNKAKTTIAVSGRVLVYPYENKKDYKPGDPVCSGPNGTISIMTRKEVREYPDRIIGTVSEIPEYETWGTENIKVNGRIWIKVK